MAPRSDPTRRGVTNDHPHHPNPQAIANIRARREALGLTRAQLAQRARCGMTTLANLEAGVTRKGITKDKIAQILDDLENAA